VTIITYVIMSNHLHVLLTVPPHEPVSDSQDPRHNGLMGKGRQVPGAGPATTFAIGAFPAPIGDPSGKNKTRPPLTREEIEEGARTYAEQAFKILDRDKTKLVYNGSWLGPMTFSDVIRLAGKYTLARMMERQDFKKRFEEGSSISMHELLYPLVQAYDSVHLVADVELGGTDQLFNLMVGRDLMKEWGQRPQIVMTTPLLEGLTADADASGKIVGDKMSKSLDNYVGVSESPEEQLGKLMSISDPLMWRYYELLSKESLETITARKSGHPKEAKRLLAMEVVARFHDGASAERVWAAWEKQFSRRETPDVIPEHALATSGEGIGLAQALAQTGLAESNGKARTLIEQGGVEVDGQKVKDKLHKLAPGTYVVKAGKRSWGKLVIA